MKIDTRLVIGAFVIVFVLALGYSTVSNYLVEYKTVSEVLEESPVDLIWVNGTILKGTLSSSNMGKFSFVVTDGISRMDVSYDGELPSSMGIDADIVMQGTYSDAKFYATKIITKCPTKYQG